MKTSAWLEWKDPAWIPTYRRILSGLWYHLFCDRQRIFYTGWQMAFCFRPYYYDAEAGGYGAVSGGGGGIFLPYIIWWLHQNGFDSAGTWSAGRISEGGWARTVLLDKDSRLEREIIPTDQEYHIKKPSARSFDDCCNEFWNLALMWQKGWQERNSLCHRPSAS